MDLLKRVNATQTTIDKWLDQSFRWGTADCGQMVGDHLGECGFETPLARCGAYKTELGAKRVIRKLGHQSMEDIIDAMGFERIAPAAAIAGDIVGFPGGDEDHQWTALGVHAGGDRIVGFAAAEGEDAIVRVGPVSVCTIAWRVN